MKITAIDVFLLEKPLHTEMQISRGGFKVRQHALVQIHTDAGISGLGEGVGHASGICALAAQLAQSIIGADPFNIERIRALLLDSQVYFECQGVAICAASALEMACWDIKGKALNLPVYQLLGGLYQNKLECYASECYWQSDASAMAQVAEGMVANGFNRIKVHLGRAEPASEAQRIAAIRQAIGADIDLMIDLNAGYNPMQAKKACQLWQQWDIAWLEEPLPPQLIAPLAELRRQVSIPLAAGENLFQLYGFKAVLEQQALDVVMPDIGRVGGLLEAKNICAIASAYGVPVSPHNYASGILLAATLHLMASTPNTQLLEIDGSENAIYQELLLSPLEYQQGCVLVPEHPGLGVQLEQSVLEAYAKQHLDAGRAFLK